MTRFDENNRIVGGDPDDAGHTLSQVPKEQRAKVYTPHTREALTDYLAANKGVTSTMFAKSIGYSVTVLSKYLSGKPEGDVPKLERLIEDALKAAAMRRGDDMELIVTKVSRAMNGAMETIRKTNDVGCITGPAGLGKTCGMRMYCLANPTAVMVTATRWRRDARAMEMSLFQAVESRGWHRGQGSRSEFLVERFRKTNRLIIVDNAHRLTRAAREWCFDFHDDTEVPICFVGNPEFLDAVKPNDQQHSRIGYCRALKLEDGNEMAERMLEHSLPDGVEDIRDLAQQVIAHEGHARALRKQMSLCKEIRHGKPDMPVRAAFQSAHTRLVRSYKLEG